jgi:hypothetical protein
VHNEKDPTFLPDSCIFEDEMKTSTAPPTDEEDRDWEEDVEEDEHVIEQTFMVSGEFGSSEDGGADGADEEDQDGDARDQAGDDEDGVGEGDD